MGHNIGKAPQFLIRTSQFFLRPFCSVMSTQDSMTIRSAPSDELCRIQSVSHTIALPSRLRRRTSPCRFRCLRRRTSPCRFRCLEALLVSFRATSAVPATAAPVPACRLRQRARNRTFARSLHSTAGCCHRAHEHGRLVESVRELSDAFFVLPFNISE